MSLATPILRFEMMGCTPTRHLNHSDAGRTAREMIRNGDVKALSIYATHVKAKGNDVVHGELVEVSIVLARQPWRIHRPDLHYTWRRRR